jgi:hypothetical protein
MTRRLRNPFSFLFTRSPAERYVERYILREHARGRALNEILDDAYVRNRFSRDQRARLLDRPEIVAALGRQAVERMKGAAAAGR